MIEIKVTRMVSALGRVGRVERCGTMVGNFDLRQDKIERLIPELR